MVRFTQIFLAACLYCFTFYSTSAARSSSSSSTGNYPSILPLEGVLHNLVIQRAFPHPRNDFTQGLAIDNFDHWSQITQRAGQVTEENQRSVKDQLVLYEGTGIWGATRVKQYVLNPASSEKSQFALTAQVGLPHQVFGEGVTVFNDKLWQLTYQNGIFYSHNLTTLSDASTIQQVKYPIPGFREGWGLASDKDQLYISDGSPTIYVADATSAELNIKRTFDVHYYNQNGRKVFVKNINELEFIPDSTGVSGELWANYYESFCILRISPLTGELLGILRAPRRKMYISPHPSVEAMNGIAYHISSTRLFMTGKLWPELYEVSVQKSARAPPPPSEADISRARGKKPLLLDLTQLCPVVSMDAAGTVYWNTVVKKSKQGSRNNLNAFLEVEEQVQQAEEE